MCSHLYPLTFLSWCWVWGLLVVSFTNEGLQGDGGVNRGERSRLQFWKSIGVPLEFWGVLLEFATSTLKMISKLWFGKLPRPNTARLGPLQFQLDSLFSDYLQTPKWIVRQSLQVQKRKEYGLIYLIVFHKNWWRFKDSYRWRFRDSYWSIYFILFHKNWWNNLKDLWQYWKELKKRLNKKVFHWITKTKYYFVYQKHK